MSRAALIGVAHWHVPLMLRGFAPAGLAVAAVWDPDPARARALAAVHGATAFADLDALLDASGLNCAFVSGPHCDMPALARAVLARRLPGFAEASDLITGIFLDRGVLHGTRGAFSQSLRTGA